jgi:hypothetical protein
MVALCLTTSCSEKGSNQTTEMSPLKVGPNNRHLVTTSGEPIFLNAETAWRIPYRLDTAQVKYYLNKRRDQKFNAIGMVAIMDVKENRGSVYGHEPFRRSADSALFDPLSPIITSGYDFWDHLDYIIDKAEEMGFYIILLPTWGSKVAGSWDGKDTSEIIFNKDNAYPYGHWIGSRYRDKKHIIWMMGGDRSGVYDKNDYRQVFRAMAEGVADGVNGEDNEDGNADFTTLLMSYHPRKKQPNSSEWFHHDPWLDFNSIQEWPEDQIRSVKNDYQLEPVKPTWLFEGRYEGYNEDWKDWQIRFQAYQSVFAGGFGHTYGHERSWGFFPGWETHLDDSAAWDMQHLYGLMTSLNDEQFLKRVPNQDIINGEQGTEERLTSNRIQATQGSDGSFAFIYTANGRDIPVKMSLLTEEKLDAYWYNPRSGKWHVDGKEFNDATAFVTNISSRPEAPNQTFDPPGAPGEGNDWVLVLRTF